MIEIIRLSDRIQLKKTPPSEDPELPNASVLSSYPLGTIFQFGDEGIQAVNSSKKEAVMSFGFCIEGN